MLKINYKDYEISQASNNHVAIFKDNQLMFHTESGLEFDKLGLKRILDWYLTLVEKIESGEQITREEFVKQRCEIDKITEEEFEKKYRVVDCNCGKCYCKGYKCLDLDGLLKENQELKEQVEELEVNYKSEHNMRVYFGTQQKEFMKWLKDEIKSSATLDKINKQIAMYIYSTTLRKFKEITGDDK